jgi:hypothetical protein
VVSWNKVTAVKWSFRREFLVIHTWDRQFVRGTTVYTERSSLQRQQLRAPSCFWSDCGQCDGRTIRGLAVCQPTAWKIVGKSLQLKCYRFKILKQLERGDNLLKWNMFWSEITCCHSSWYTGMGLGKHLQTTEHARAVQRWICPHPCRERVVWTLLLAEQTVKSTAHLDVMEMFDGTARRRPWQHKIPLKRSCRSTFLSHCDSFWRSSAR